MSLELIGNKTLIVTGIAYYPRVHTPMESPIDGKKFYSLDLVVDEETAAKLEKLGLNRAKRLVKDEATKREYKEPKSYPDHKGAVFTFRKNTHSKDGNELAKPVITDANLEPLTANIGNGSKVVISAALRPWSYMGKEGQTAYLNGVQVLNLVAYEGGLGFKKQGSSSDF